MNAVSLFSGCGGFDLGAKKAGVNIIWANDVDQPAVNAYKSLLPHVPIIHEDIRKIKSFPHADILIGCYPCTGFSLGSRRRKKGTTKRDLFQNATNFLYVEFIRAIRQINPKYLFVENVKGMLSAENGWFLQQQINGIEELGYSIIEPTILNAADYGVPQSRKRVFLVGIRNDIEFQYQFILPTHGKNGHLPYVTLKNTIYNMKRWPRDEYLDYKFHGHYLTRNRKRDWNDVSYTIVAHSHHIPLHPMGDPMIKIGKDEWALQGHENRRLSWKECALLQGLPDTISPSGNLNDKYRVIGNAVPPKLGEVLLQPIIEFENN